MAINKVLMNAILAMDSYNRGYNAGIVFGNNPGDNNYSVDTPTITKVGEATVVATRGQSDAENIGFYGIAYSYDGETVISYRGTDQLVRWNNIGSDIWNGYGVGGGSAAGDQAMMAFDFYNEVVVR